MKRVALTGGIACGKSIAGRIFSEQGHEIIEADNIARDVMVPGTTCFRDIKRCFGPAVFDDEGLIDRKVLGRMVMSDAALRAKLNSIVHPLVIKRWQEWLKEREQGQGLALVIVPLLYEIGEGASWDSVVCVYASRAEQVSRLAKRGIPAEEAVKWLSAQMKLAEKMRRADFVLCNNGSKTILGHQIDNVAKMILER